CAASASNSPTRCAAAPASSRTINSKLTTPFCVSVAGVGVFDEVCDAIRASMEETQTPGVAVGLLHDGQEHVAGFGVTSLENPLEVTPDTLFQIGSITKTF